MLQVWSHHQQQGQGWFWSSAVSSASNGEVVGPFRKYLLLSTGSQAYNSVTTSIVTTIFCPRMPMQQTCITLPTSSQLALNRVALQDHAVIGHILTQLHLHEPSSLLSQSTLADHTTVSFIQVGNSRQGCCSGVNCLGGARVAEGCLP